MDAITQLQTVRAIEDEEVHPMAESSFFSASGSYGLLHDPNRSSHDSHGPLRQLYGESNVSAFNTTPYLPTPAHGLQAGHHTFMRGTHQESNPPALWPTGSTVSDIQSYGYFPPDTIPRRRRLQEKGFPTSQSPACSEAAPMVAEPLNLDHNGGIVGTPNWIALKKPRPLAGANVIALRRESRVVLEIILAHLPGGYHGIKIPATASVKNLANTTGKALLKFRIRLYGATTKRLYEVVCENCQKREGRRRGTPSVIDFKAEHDVIEPKDGKIHVNFSFCCYPKCHKLGDTEYLLDIVLSVDEGQHYIVAQYRLPLSFRVVPKPLPKLPPRQISPPIQAEEERGDYPAPEPPSLQGRMGGANTVVLRNLPGDGQIHHQWPDIHDIPQDFGDGWSYPLPLLEEDIERTPTLTEVNPDSASFAGGVRIWLKGMDFPALLPLFARFGPAVVPTTFSASNLLVCHLPPRTVQGIINVTLSKDPQPNAPEYGISIARFTYKEDVDELILILLRIQGLAHSPLLQAVLSALNGKVKSALDRGTTTNDPIELPPTYVSARESSPPRTFSHREPPEQVLGTTSQSDFASTWYASTNAAGPPTDRPNFDAVRSNRNAPQLSSIPSNAPVRRWRQFDIDDTSYMRPSSLSSSKGPRSLQQQTLSSDTELRTIRRAATLLAANGAPTHINSDVVTEMPLQGSMLPQAVPYPSRNPFRQPHSYATFDETRASPTSNQASQKPNNTPDEDPESIVESSLSPSGDVFDSHFTVDPVFAPPARSNTGPVVGLSGVRTKPSSYLSSDPPVPPKKPLPPLPESSFGVDSMEELPMHSPFKGLEEPVMLRSSSADVRETEGLDMSPGFQHVGRPAHATVWNKSTKHDFLAWKAPQEDTTSNQGSDPDEYIDMGHRPAPGPVAVIPNMRTRPSSSQVSVPPVPPTIILGKNNEYVMSCAGMDKGDKPPEIGGRVHAVAESESTKDYFPISAELAKQGMTKIRSQSPIVSSTRPRSFRPGIGQPPLFQRPTDWLGTASSGVILPKRTDERDHWAANDNALDEEPDAQELLKSQTLVTGQGALGDESFSVITPFSIYSYLAGEPLPPSPDSLSSVGAMEERVVLKTRSTSVGKMEELDMSPGFQHGGRPTCTVAWSKPADYDFPAEERREATAEERWETNPEERWETKPEERRDANDTGRVKRRTAAPKDNVPLRRLKTTFLRSYRRLSSLSRIDSDPTTIRGKSMREAVDSQIGQSPPVVVQSHHGPKASGTRNDGPTPTRSGGHIGIAKGPVWCPESSFASPPGISRATNTPPVVRSNRGDIAGNSTGVTHTNPGSLRLEDPIESGLVAALSDLRRRSNFQEMLSTTNDWDQTLAHLSIIYNYLSLLESLVDWRINLTIADSNGLTALHYAYMKGDLDSVRILRRGGAPEFVKDKLGRAPSDLRPEGFGTSTDILNPWL